MNMPANIHDQDTREKQGLLGPLGWMYPYPQPIVSINTGCGNQWAFSPDFVNVPPSRTATITLHGSRYCDFVAANAGAQQPAGYTWHHLYKPDMQYNQCKMQLVETWRHRATCPHKGGFSQYDPNTDSPDTVADTTNVVSRALETDPLHGAPPEAPCILAPKDAEATLAALEKKNGVSLGKDLREFHLSISSDETLLKNVLSKTFKQQETWVEMIYTLDEKKNGIFGVLQQEKEAKIRREFSENGNIPFAEDGFGNIFYCKPNDGAVWFYDHEFVIDPVRLGITLKDLLSST
jgi:hypothetical protein